MLFAESIAKNIDHQHSNKGNQAKSLLSGISLRLVLLMPLRSHGNHWSKYRRVECGFIIFH